MIHFNGINSSTHIVRLGYYASLLIKIFPKVTQCGVGVRDSFYLLR